MRRLFDDGADADDQQAPRSLAHLRHRAELLFASGRSLQRCQTQPDGEVAALAKGSAVGARVVTLSR